MIAQNPKPYSQYPMIFQLNRLYWFQIWSFLGMSLPHIFLRARALGQNRRRFGHLWTMLVVVSLRSHQILGTPILDRGQHWGKPWQTRQNKAEWNVLTVLASPILGASRPQETGVVIKFTTLVGLCHKIELEIIITRLEMGVPMNQQQVWELQWYSTVSPWCSTMSCQSANTLGRRRALLTTAALFVVSPLLSALSPNYAVLLFGRHPAGGFPNDCIERWEINGNQGQIVRPLNVEPQFLLILVRLSWSPFEPLRLCWTVYFFEMNIHYPWRIHGAAIYGNVDPINIPQMLAYIYIYQHNGSYGLYLPKILGVDSHPY